MNGIWIPLYGAVNSVRKKLNSNTGRMVFNSPGNTNAIIKIIEESEGMAETQMKVRYSNDSSLSGTKRTATIKDAQISETMNIDVSGELKGAYDEVYGVKRDIKSLNIQSENNIILYEEFLRKRNENG